MVLRLGSVVSKERSPLSVTANVPVSKQYAYDTGNFLLSFGGGPLIVRSKTEKIVYTNSSKGARHHSNFCLHTITTSTYSGDVSSFVTKFNNRGGTPTVRTEYFGHHAHALTNHLSTVIVAKSALGSQLRDKYLGDNAQVHINEGFLRCKPDLTKLSLPNFLLELTDVRRLFELWRSNITRSKNVAGGYLNYQFGWKPTIGDIQAMIAALLNLKHKLALFKELAGNLIKEETTVLNDNISHGGTVGSGSTTTVDWQARHKRRCTAHFVFRVEGLGPIDDWLSAIASTLDALGFELNPRLIWEAIPFTFVIDWFFGIGRLLEGFKTDTYELPVVLVDSYLQYKEQVVIETATSLDLDPSTSWPANQCPSWVDDEKFFHRLPILPDFATFKALGWKLPSMSQGWKLLALAVVLRPVKE